jgi:tetratricopeptide (TPR) repeat protein
MWTSFIFAGGLAACGAAQSPATPDATAAQAPKETALAVGAEAVALTGKQLFPPEMDNAERTRAKVKLLTARQNERASGNDAEGPLGVAVALTELHRFRESLPWFDQAVWRAPEERTMYAKRGRAHFALRDFIRAREDFQKAGDSEMLGMIALVEGDATAAQLSLQKANQNVDALAKQLGLSEWADIQKRPDEARTVLKKFLERPDWAEPLYVVAEAEAARLGVRADDIDKKSN